jgi:hypothetical protein
LEGHLIIRKERERERERDTEIQKKKGTYYQMIKGAHGKKRIKNCT